MLADLYPMRRKLKNFWMHPNENLCRSLDLFGQDIYHNRTMLPPRETMLGSNLCKRTLQRCLCTNPPQFRRYSVCPNITGSQSHIYPSTEEATEFGAMAFFRDGNYKVPVSSVASGSPVGVSFNASKSNDVFGSASTVQVAALRSLVLIRAY